MSEPGICDICWGGHGCDLPQGHDGPHLCGDPDEGAHSRLSFEADVWVQRGDEGDGWGEPWPATPFSVGGFQRP